MIITFIGHSNLCLTPQLKSHLRAVIESHLNGSRVNGSPVTFYCGGYGDFDTACATVIKELKMYYPQIESVYITPYIDSSRLADAKQSGLYDRILYPGLESVPYRYAILKRNEFMIDHADLIIAYVEHHHGGAYKAWQYAIKKQKAVMNLAEIPCFLKPDMI